MAAADILFEVMSLMVKKGPLSEMVAATKGDEVEKVVGEVEGGVGEKELE